MNRVVFSRHKKVRKSFSIDERIIRRYMELHGLTPRQAREKYRLFLLSVRMDRAELYA